MEIIKEIRELLIDNKIFTKNDILALINLFIKLSNDILEKSKEIKRNDLIHEGCNEKILRSDILIQVNQAWNLHILTTPYTMKKLKNLLNQMSFLPTKRLWRLIYILTKMYLIADL